VASTHKLDLVRSLGADHAIDYTATDISDDGQRYDVVLDIGGTFIATPNSADLDALRALIEAGSLTPAVDRVIGLEGLPDAIRDLAHGRVRGKVVIANEAASR
jgi:NADPH:quinone reductase-like Zn-dependent oxidoreductase